MALNCGSSHRFNYYNAKHLHYSKLLAIYWTEYNICLRLLILRAFVLVPVLVFVCGELLPSYNVFLSLWSHSHRYTNIEQLYCACVCLCATQLFLRCIFVYAFSLSVSLSLSCSCYPLPLPISVDCVAGVATQ